MYQIKEMYHPPKLIGEAIKHTTQILIDLTIEQSHQEKVEQG